MTRTIFAFFLLVLLSSNAIASAVTDRWAREGWKTDFSIKSVNFAEILSGGPPKDGIPPIDDPQFVPVEDMANLSDRDPVIGSMDRGCHDYGAFNPNRSVHCLVSRQRGFRRCV